MATATETTYEAKVLCSWCGKDMGTKAGFSIDDDETHTICPPCREQCLQGVAGRAVRITDILQTGKIVGPSLNRSSMVIELSDGRRITREFAGLRILK